MRYSRHTRNNIENRDALTGAQFFGDVARSLSKHARTPSVLLVGGSNFESLALRQSQAPLRYDLRPSYWSHAAIILDWPSDRLDEAVGVEATLRPTRAQVHDPSQNGVTAFNLADYTNDAVYPNLCIAAITPTTGASSSTKSKAGRNLVEGWRAAITHAAKHPNAARSHYNLYAMIAEWLRYAMIPGIAANPLLGSMAMPSAALVDHVFAAGGIDLVPSSTAPNAAPEHLWATFCHWSEHIAARWGTLQVWRRLKDPGPIVERQPEVAASVEPQLKKRVEAPAKRPRGAKRGRTR